MLMLTTPHSVSPLSAGSWRAGDIMLQSSPQPRFDNEADFKRFGRPRLFFGISAGNLDSIVANYTGNGKVRDVDAFFPGGQPLADSAAGKR